DWFALEGGAPGQQDPDEPSAVEEAAEDPGGVLPVPCQVSRELLRGRERPDFLLGAEGLLPGRDSHGRVLAFALFAHSFEASAVRCLAQAGISVRAVPPPRPVVRAGALGGSGERSRLTGEGPSPAARLKRSDAELAPPAP